MNGPFVKRPTIWSTDQKPEWMTRPFSEASLGTPVSFPRPPLTDPKRIFQAPRPS